MRTHIIENGQIVSTILATVEEARAAFPDAICCDAALGGYIGDAYDEITATIIPALRPELSVEQHNTQILDALEIIDRKSIRALREGNNARIAELESQASELRLQLKK